MRLFEDIVREYKEPSLNNCIEYLFKNEKELVFKVDKDEFNVLNFDH